MKKASLARILAAMSAATIAVSCLASCGQETSSSQENSAAEESSAASTATDSSTETVSGEKGLEPYADTVTVSMFASVDPTMNFDNGESFEDNLWSRLYKDRLNIEIDYKWIVTNDQYTEKLNVAIASKDFADIMSFGVGDKNMKLMSDAGYLQDLTDIYNEYATDYTKSIVEGDGGTALDSSVMDGKLVGIPNTSAPIEASAVLWIRTDWLEQSGKEAPKTMDELYELAQIFKEADYDGVGNVYGISMDKGTDTNAVSSVQGILSGFGAYPQKWLEADDGSLVYGSIQPEVRDALEYLAKMYAEGLIDQEYGVKDSTAVGEDACAGHIGLYLGGHASPLWPLNATVKEDADWTPYPIPTVDGSDPVQYVDIAVANYYVATKDCQNPEAILKMMNLFTEICFSENCDPLYYTTSEQYREPFKHARIQAWPTTKNIDIALRIKDYRENGDMSVIEANQETLDMFNYCEIYNETGAREGGWDYARVFDVGGSELVLNDYLEKDNIKYNGFYGPATDTMATKKATLDKMEAQTFSQIIMGASPIEEFDTFVEQWTSLGGADITKEVNEWAANR